MGKGYRLRIDEALNILVERYPMAFFPKDSVDTQPLMRGIFTLVTGQNRDIPRPVIREFLRGYTRKDRYLRALVTRTHRVALDGSPAEEVSQKHREHAKRMLDARQAKRERQQAA